MLIILEGADAVGKTTIGNALVDAAITSGIHKHVKLAAGPPAPGRTAIQLYEHDLLVHRDAIMSPDTLVIADRWHLGELVYGPLLRGGTLLDQDELEHIELMLDAMGALRYLVTVQDSAELLRRFQARGGDPLVTFAQTNAINRWYVYWKTGQPNVERWKILHSPVNQPTARMIIDVAKMRNKLVSNLAKHPTYVGSPLPRALFVGDVPNGWNYGDAPQLAFVPEAGNSAAYLLSAMRQGNVKDVGLVNSADADLGPLWVDLGTPHVLALGKRAAARLLRASVPYDLTNHPQWQRRFKHHEIDQYTEVLVRHSTHYPRPRSNRETHHT
jgi:hypothetical protein